MITRLYGTYGKLSASHQLEVIMLTLIVAIFTMSFKFPFNIEFIRVCGWNNECVEKEEPAPIYKIVMAVFRYCAIFRIYFRLRDIYRLGSKYILGITGVFTLCSSILFSSAVIHFLKWDLYTVLQEAFPFFLFLVDLSNPCLLAKFALTATSQTEVCEKISRGMAIIGPSVTLDMWLRTLGIGVGTLSGIKELEIISCFCCISVLSSYLVFMMFFPAFLSLLLELEFYSSKQPTWQTKGFAKSIKEEEEQLPNHLVQNVKLIMSMGLVGVHIQNRWSNEVDEKTSLLNSNIIDFSSKNFDPNIPLWQFYLLWLVDMRMELIIFFGIFFFLIYHIKNVRNHQHPTQSSEAIVIDSQNSISNKSTLTGVTFREAASFTIGDDNSFENDPLPIKESSNRVIDQQPVKTAEPPETRSLSICLDILNNIEEGPSQLTNEEIKMLILHKYIPTYKLESILPNSLKRAVQIRREILENEYKYNDKPFSVDGLPYFHYNYAPVIGACCENVIGYAPLPVGVAGPLLLDGKKYPVPMATTEGCLVASTNRGCKALRDLGGIQSYLDEPGMTRAPLIKLPTTLKAIEMKAWLKREESFNILKESFEETSRFAKLKQLQVYQDTTFLYVRFQALTGDAMGMNMVSKGVEKALNKLNEFFPEMEVQSLSSNVCTDKKSATINYFEGRGKSVICEATVSAAILSKVLKTTSKKLVDLNTRKNIIGSSMAGCHLGGFNAQAANIVTAIYIATGQDVAQNITSSNCKTSMECTGKDGQDLFISCFMPSIEIGTIGGGTILDPQATCLELMGVCGSCVEEPGKNAQTLARILCAAVMAGEISLMAELAEGNLVKCHMKHNRSNLSINADTSMKRNISLDNSILYQKT